MTLFDTCVLQYLSVSKSCNQVQATPLITHIFATRLIFENNYINKYVSGCLMFALFKFASLRLVCDGQK